MNFYVVETLSNGSVLGCERSERRARQLGRDYCHEGGFRVTRVSIHSSRNGGYVEAIRRLLGQVGGYAEESVPVAEVAYRPRRR